jgi:hypothetical protein
VKLTIAPTGLCCATSGKQVVPPTQPVMSHYLEEGRRSGAIPALWIPGGAILDYGRERDESAHDLEGKEAKRLCAWSGSCCSTCSCFFGSVAWF